MEHVTWCSELLRGKHLKDIRLSLQNKKNTARIEPALQG
jgi:hypothetical protein